jgi:hypothetical protein
VSAASQQLLSEHLWRDEEVLWSGRPIAAGPVATQAARRAFFNGLGAAIGSATIGFLVIGKLTLRFGVGVFELAVIAGAIGALVFVGWTATRVWWGGGALAARTVYAVTNRRVLMVQGNDEFWVGRREIADVAIRGGDIRIRRQLTDVERRQSADSGLEDRLADRIEIGTREIVLAAVPDPRRVLELLQTLKHPSAS